MKAAMTAILGGLLSVVLLCVVIVGIAYTEQAEHKMDPNAVNDRIRSFYLAVAEQRYDDAYNFFGPNVKRDTPKKEYVDRLKGTVAGLAFFSHAPQITSAGQEKSVVKAVTKVRFVLRDGEVVPAEHTTYWMAIPYSKTFTFVGKQWYIVRDEMNEQPGTISKKTAPPHIFPARIMAEEPPKSP